MTLSARFGAATDIGLVRERNEDAVLAVAPVFAVADGMGGHQDGHLASALAIAGLGRFEGAAAVDAGSVLAALHEANRDIFVRAETGASEGMGTTVVGIALSRNDAAADSLLLFNVGDSRAYRLRDGELRQLSEDHSLVAELVLKGDLSSAEAQTDSRRNVVTRALGIDETVEIDQWFVEPMVGDRYLMCSDGLTGEVSDLEIAETLRTIAAPAKAADVLVEMALSAGGRDNVSAVVVDIEGVGQVESAIDEDTDHRDLAPSNLERPVDETR